MVVLVVVLVDGQRDKGTEEEDPTVGCLEKQAERQMLVVQAATSREVDTRVPLTWSRAVVEQRKSDEGWKVRRECVSGERERLRKKKG